MRFDRVHLKEFGASDLVHELVYYVTTDDYNRHMDVQQGLIYSLKEAFEREGLDFAYPTQTVIVQKEA